MSTATSRAIPATMCLANVAPNPRDPELPGRQFLQLVNTLALEWLRADNPPVTAAAAHLETLCAPAAEAVIERMDL
jgi:hypothetical protein